MKITGLENVDRVKMTMEGARDTFKQIPISKADGTPAYSFRVFTIEPGGHTPHHTHAFEHINYVISGTGCLVARDGEERPIKGGDFALVLSNEIHQYRNKSDTEPLVLICAVPKEYE